MRAAPHQARIGVGCSLAARWLRSMAICAISAPRSRNEPRSARPYGDRVRGWQNPCALISLGGIEQPAPRSNTISGSSRSFHGASASSRRLPIKSLHPLRLIRARLNTFSARAVNSSSATNFSARNQQRQLAHVEAGHRLKRFDVGRESLVGITISGGVEQVLRRGQPRAAEQHCRECAHAEPGAAPRHDSRTPPSAASTSRTLSRSHSVFRKLLVRVSRERRVRLSKRITAGDEASPAAGQNARTPASPESFNTSCCAQVCAEAGRRSRSSPGGWRRSPAQCGRWFATDVPVIGANHQ